MHEIMDRKSSSRIIVALDPPEEIDDVVSWALNIVDNTIDYVVGYEIGLPLLIRANGVKELSMLLDRISDLELRIADLKLADISDMMILAIKPLIEIGFNAFTAHAFIGYSGALKELGSFLLKNNSKLICIVSMSQPGGVDFFDKYLDKLTDIAIKAGAWGLVAPATRPWVVRKLRKLIDEMGWRHIKILAPGIGYQGGRPGQALENGADYEIIGRYVTRSNNPRDIVREVARVHGEVIRRIES